MRQIPEAGSPSPSENPGPVRQTPFFKSDWGNIQHPISNITQNNIFQQLLTVVYHKSVQRESLPSPLIKQSEGNTKELVVVEMLQYFHS